MAKGGEAFYGLCFHAGAVMLIYGTAHRWGAIAGGVALMAYGFLMMFGLRHGERKP